MNKDKVRKYISDIQIAMGKILEEIEECEVVATTLKNYDNLDQETAELTEDLGISKEEASTITDILNKTIPKEKSVELSEEDLMAQIAAKCGIENFTGNNINDLQENVLEKLEDNK